MELSSLSASLVHLSLFQLLPPSPQRRASVTPAEWSAGKCTAGACMGMKKKQSESLKELFFFVFFLGGGGGGVQNRLTSSCRESIFSSSPTFKRGGEKMNISVFELENVKISSMGIQSNPRGDPI